jgi:peptide/nickel transport system substrate-binding protein
VVLLAATDLAPLNAMSQVGADLLQRLGLKVDYQALDWGTVQQRRLSKSPTRDGGWSLFCTFIAGSDAFTPATNINLRGNGEAGPVGWPTSSNLERFRDDWFAAADLNDQKLACANIQKQCEIDVPYVPTGQFFQPTAHRGRVFNLNVGFPTFWNVGLTT